MVTATLQAVPSCLYIAINFHYVRVRILCTVTMAVLIFICTLDLHVVMAGQKSCPIPSGKLGNTENDLSYDRFNMLIT